MTDYRAVLDGTREISVGAFARAQRRRRWLIAAAGVALIAGAVWVHALLRPRETAAPTGPVPILVRCVAKECGFEGTLSVPLGQADGLLLCPKCGQHSCRKVWECRNPDCGYRFLPTGESTELRCPKCGSHRVGTAQPTLLENGGR